MSTIKWELEDTALRYLKPQQYRIVQLMKQKRNQRETYIEDVMDSIAEELSKVRIEAEISGKENIFTVRIEKWLPSMLNLMRYMTCWQ